ncbi:hypothetical protein DSO57_1027478 [Entomophthora muscae]|uniref:Uncharacterized protein n=1 Tax=Entomophthora muscae TaxID=34485 RepID=A0ACC2T288_9FUNG|nr:hypothetical protein DSO57_1027478 [Entomophthora muscae]
MEPPVTPKPMPASSPNLLTNHADNLFGIVLPQYSSLIPPLSRAQLTPLEERNLMALLQITVIITQLQMGNLKRSGAMSKIPPRISLPHMRSTKISPFMLTSHQAPLLPVHQGMPLSPSLTTSLAFAMLLLALGTPL